jgi:hypothetical protein
MSTRAKTYLRTLAAAVIIGFAWPMLASNALAARTNDCYTCLPLLWCPEQSEGDYYCDQACGSTTHWNGSCSEYEGCQNSWNRISCPE